MALKQLSAWIMVGVFTLASVSSALILATDKTKEEKPDGKVAWVVKEKLNKGGKVSPWETRQMIPSGPKY